MSRDWLLYLDDLIDSAEKIERFLRGRSYDDFAADELLFDAVLFNLALIGEAVKKLPQDAKTSAPDADWAGPARMRDLIAHHYFAVDSRIVWEAGEPARAEDTGSRAQAARALRPVTSAGAG